MASKSYKIAPFFRAFGAEIQFGAELSCASSNNLFYGAEKNCEEVKGVEKGWGRF